MDPQQLQAPILVFVRPQAAGNIGAIARAMSNFGAQELRLVGEGVVYDFRADDPFSKMDWAMAKRGEHLLKAVKWYPTLGAALFDVGFVLGTSGRDLEFEKGYGRPFCNPTTAWSQVYEWAKGHQDPMSWALVIGPEDDGLNEQEASLCQSLIRIPTVGSNPSLNAAMAVGCLLYHFNQIRSGEIPLSPPPLPSTPFINPRKLKNLEASGRSEWSTFEQKESFLSYLMETLALTAFLKFPDIEAVRARIRRWIQIAPIPVGELLFAFEIIYHLKSWGSGKFEERNFLTDTKRENS
jgi:TrmH family RNA methyltransferase